MKIYLEVIIVLVCFVIYLFWKIWNKRSRRKHLKKYSIENDKSKTGEDRQKEIRNLEQRAIDRNKQGLGVKNTNPIRPPKPKGRNVLPTATPSSIRKNSFSFRKFLKGRRK